MEYLAVMGLSLLLVIPMVVIYYEQSSSLSDDINAARLQKIAQETIDAAEEVYYLGAPTTKTLTIHMPRNVQAITIQDASIVIEYTTTYGQSSYIASSELALNLTGTLQTHEGPHRVSVKAGENNIQISESS